MIAEITINDFKTTTWEDIDIIPWDELGRVLGREEMKNFYEFITHQGNFFGGALLQDVENFLNSRKRRLVNND